MRQRMFGESIVRWLWWHLRLGLCVARLIPHRYETVEGVRADGSADDLCHNCCRWKSQRAANPNLPAPHPTPVEPEKP